MGRGSGANRSSRGARMTFMPYLVALSDVLVIGGLFLIIRKEAQEYWK